jgi:surfactin synthase thioesterase subunit
MERKLAASRQVQGAKPHRLVCIPHAGGGASAYARWRAHRDGEVIVVPLPGRDGDHAQAPLKSIGEMAHQAATFIEDRRLERVMLFGHSMGALVAYEAAKLLRDAAQSPIERLTVSGCQCPASFSSDRLSEIGDDEQFLRAVTEYGGLPRELLQDPAFIDYVLPILRADLAACDAYRYEPGEPLDIPILAFGGANDVRVPLHDVFGWRKFTSAQFDARVFPGGHFFINAHMDSVLAAIRDGSICSGIPAEPARV